MPSTWLLNRRTGTVKRVSRRDFLRRSTCVAAYLTSGMAAWEGCRGQLDLSGKYHGANVILISIDTLRSDHLSCYGYARKTSPNIDAFGRDCVLFRNAIAPAPSTLPSHASMLTSLIPPHHGASFPLKRPIPKKIETLAEILRRYGYRAVSYHGGAKMAPEFGFGQGFEIYEEKRRDDFDHPVEAAMDWLRQNSGETFFMFLHTYEVHLPYTPNPELLSFFETSYGGPLPRSISKAVKNDINHGRRKITEADGKHTERALRSLGYTD